MAKFTIDIADAGHLAGITAAREKHNETVPDTEDAPRVDHADYCADDAAYVQRVMAGAAASYANAYGTSDAAIAEMETKLATMKARMQK